MKLNIENGNTDSEIYKKVLFYFLMKSEIYIVILNVIKSIKQQSANTFILNLEIKPIKYNIQHVKQIARDSLNS